MKNAVNSNTSINDSKSSKEVNAMNNNTKTSNQSTKPEVKALSFEAALILGNLMQEAQGDKNYKALFRSSKYGCLLAKRSNLLAFAKRQLPKASDEDIKKFLNELFVTGAMFCRHLDRGYLLGMNQDNWRKARALVLDAAAKQSGADQQEVQESKQEVKKTTSKKAAPKKTPKAKKTTKAAIAKESQIPELEM